VSDSSTSPESATIVEVEFDVGSRSHAFIDASAGEECTVELAEINARPDDRYAQFFMVSGGRPERIASAVTGDSALEATPVTAKQQSGLVEVLVQQSAPTAMLVRRGAIVRTVRASNGSGRIVAEIPIPHEPGELIERFLDRYPSVGLRRKREKDSVSPGITRTGCEQIVVNALTDRQREVLETAFEAGYYDWPRRRSGAQIADTLNISSATFSEHISAAERNLLTHLFDESDPD